MAGGAGFDGVGADVGEDAPRTMSSKKSMRLFVVSSIMASLLFCCLFAMMLPPGLEPKQHRFHLRLSELSIPGPASIAPPGLGHETTRTSTLLLESPLRIMPPEPWHLPSCGLIANSSISGIDHAGATAVPSTQLARECAVAVAQSLITMEETSCVSGNCQGQRQFLRKPMCATEEPIKSLRVTHLPHCAEANDVQNAFTVTAIDGCCFVSIMRDERGDSKCFGFVQFSTSDAARAAMVACNHRKIILHDHMRKVSHIKADWAKAECKDFKQKTKTARTTLANWNC